MFSKLLASSVAALLLVKESEAGWAAAGFQNNSIYGYVAAGNGYVYGMLNIAGLSADNYSAIGGPSCFSGGLSYHIHEKWEHSGYGDKIGSTDCGSTYTGGHWDPWLACGSATGNTYCVSKGGCVNGSSVLGSANNYDCSYFDDNPYSCEVGDWSGKYGKAYVDNDGNITFVGYSPYEVEGYDLLDYSVVFHCTDGTRAFCSPFQWVGYSNDSRPQQDSGAMGAVFGDGGYYAMFDNGTNYGMFNTSAFDTSSCSSSMLYYRIFDDWDSNNYYEMGDTCNDVVGGFYDPTVSCAVNSSSIFCSYGERCDSAYNYTCDYSEPSDRYLCAPGDLSGKFGPIYLSSYYNYSYDSFWVYEMDELMIDLSLLDGKSLVLQCADTMDIVGCAMFFGQSTTTMMPYSTMTSMMSSMESSMGGSGSEDSGFETSVQFGTILVVLSTMVKMMA